MRMSGKRKRKPVLSIIANECRIIQTRRGVLASIIECASMLFVIAVLVLPSPLKASS